MSDLSVVCIDSLTENILSKFTHVNAIANPKSDIRNPKSQIELFRQALDEMGDRSESFGIEFSRKSAADVVVFKYFTA